MTQEIKDTIIKAMKASIDAGAVTHTAAFGVMEYLIHVPITDETEDWIEDITKPKKTSKRAPIIPQYSSGGGCGGGGCGR